MDDALKISVLKLSVDVVPRRMRVFVIDFIISSLL